MQQKVENLILGSGFTGLEIATRLPGAKIIASDLGGLLQNIRVGDFGFDLGGHVYTLDNPDINQLMRESDAVIHPTRNAYYIYDKWENKIEFPVQNHADQLGITLGGDGNENPQNFAEYAMSVFGKDFCERFFFPFNSRVWTIAPSKMSFDWIDGRIKLPAEKDENWGMNASFAYAPGPNIVLALLKRTTGVDLVNAEILDINHTEHYVLTSVGSFKYKNLFDTTGKAFDRYVGRKELLRNYVLSVGLGFEKQLPFDFHWAYGKIGAQVHRITLLSRYHPSLAPAGSDSLLLEIPIRDIFELRGESRLLVSDAIDETSKISIALKLVEAAGLATAKEIESYMPTTFFSRVSRGYPIPTIGARKLVAEQKYRMAKRNAYSLGRWGSHGYFNLQHLVADVDATMKLFEAQDQIETIIPSYFPEYFFGSFYYKAVQNAIQN